MKFHVFIHKYFTRRDFIQSVGHISKRGNCGLVSSSTGYIEIKCDTYSIKNIKSYI